jgi:putative endonuclease
MTDKIETGTKGEQLAADFLVSKGFRVVCRNYRFGKSEIDLIVRRGDWLIFVEVKTRSSDEYGDPEQFVDRKKSRKVFQAAEHYIFSTDWQGHVRFDIVAVKLNDPPEIVQLEDAIN